MNIRSPLVLIGVFLALFWTAGLLLTLDRAPRVDEAYVLPSLKSATNVEIDSVVVERRDKEGETNFRFVRKDDDWRLVDGKQSVKVEGFRIRDLIKEAREAKRDPDVRVGGGNHGLQPPRTTVILSGTPRRKGADAGAERTWKLFLGNETDDKKYVYVSSSDRPGQVFATPRGSVSSLSFKNANDLRSKRVFDFSEPTVQSIVLKGPKNEVELKKQEAGSWLFVKPNLGFADAGGAAPEKAEKDFHKAPEAVSEKGVKGLLSAIAAVRVDSDDDFVSPGGDVLERNNLVPGQESLRITIASGDAKKPIEETLLVGRQDGKFAYARLASDDGVFRLPAKALEPILSALESPEKLRSRDLSPMPVKDSDGVMLSFGKDEAKLTLEEPRQWKVRIGTAPVVRANPKAVESLLDVVQGRGAVVAYRDGSAEDAGKVDAELGFDQPQASVSVYAKSVDRDGALKKDAQPTVALVFGKTDGDVVWVKRTTAVGPAARFTTAKSTLERLVPREGLIGFLETVLPTVDVPNVTRVEIDRGGKTMTAIRSAGRWRLGEGADAADAAAIEQVLRSLSGLALRRWATRLDEKTDLAEYGLKSPDLTVTLSLKPSGPSAELIGSVFGQLASFIGEPALAALGAMWGNTELGGEKIVVAFGKEAADDAGNRYVRHAKLDRVGLVPGIVVAQLRSADWRDRSTLYNPQLQAAALAVGAPASQYLGGYLDAAPLTTLQLGRSDGAAVKSLTASVRTPVELRRFSFQRDGKTWIDASKLSEFEPNPEAIDAVANLVARLDMNRLIALAGGDRDDRKLSPKDAAVVLEATFNDGRKTTLAIGASFENVGHYTQTSTWPGAVFLLNPDRVDQLLRGAAYFARERLASNETKEPRTK